MASVLVSRRLLTTINGVPMNGRLGSFLSRSLVRPLTRTSTHHYATEASPAAAPKKIWMTPNIKAVSEGTLTTATTASGHQIQFDEPIKAGGTNKGATPLENVLSALAACESFIARVLAKEKGFAFDKIEYQVTGGIDLAGPLKKAPGVSMTFQTVNIVARIHTNESEARVKEFTEEIGTRCPVFQLFHQAGVTITESWVRVPTSN